MKILITGGNGFIGQHCIPHLLAQSTELEVHALSRNMKRQAATTDRLHWHPCDLLQAKELQACVSAIKPTHLLHLAWDTTPGAYQSSQQNLLWREASLSLLYAFYQNGGKRAVMAGSCLEYGDVSGVYSEETTPTRPTTLYGTSKLSVCRMMEAFSQQTGLSGAWARIFYLYGPGEAEARLIPGAIHALNSEESFTCRHGQLKRDYLYVEDVAQALVQTLFSQVCGPINIGSGKQTGLRGLLETLGQRMGKAELLRIEEQAAPKGEPVIRVADITRLRDEVGFLPQYSLEEGLKKTLQYWANRPLPQSIKA